MRAIVGLFMLSATAAMALPAAAQAQQCTVPNTLTNGQVADASEVMDNFNAVAACVDDANDNAVTHEGTPQAGEIAVFNGPTGITGGDLTGDVTTSGSTATTLSDTSVIPGTYTNSTITVDEKGRVTSAESGPLGGGGIGGPFTTLLYDTSYSLPSGTQTIIDLTTANEVMVVARNITKSSSGAFIIQFSVDGGATYVTSASYIVDINGAGQVGFNDGAIYSYGSASSARTHYLYMANLKSPTPRVFDGSRRGIFDNDQPITHMRIYASRTITGGSLTVLAR